MAAKQQLITEIIVKDQNTAQVLGKSEAAIIDFAKAAESAGRKIEKAFAAKDEAMKKTQAQTNNLQKSFSTMRVAVLGAAAAIAAGVATFIKITSEAAAAERAMNKLRLNLELVGIKSNIVSKSLIDQADALGRTTSFSDDAIVSTQALLVALGVAPAKLQKATQAVVDTAAATGKGLEDVAAALAKSFSGSAREIKLLVPEIGNLTEAQLKAGGAVDFLAGRFAGAASKEVKTFSGAMEQSKNALNNVFEELGNIVVKSASVVKSVNTMADAFNTLADNIKEAFGTGKGAQDRQMTNIQEELNRRREGIDVLSISARRAPANQRQPIQNLINQMEKEYLKLVREEQMLQGKITDEKKKQTTEAEKEFKAAEKKRKDILDQDRLNERAKELKPKIEDIQKEINKELDTKSHAIVREFDERKKLVDEYYSFGKMREDDYHQYILDLAADRQSKFIKLNKDLADEKLKKEKEASDKAIASAHESANMIGFGANANVTGALGSLGPGGIIAAGITELVLNANELPDKIEGTIHDLEKGISKGIPHLIDYLSNRFVPSLAAALGGIFKGVASNIGGILKGGITMGLDFVSGGAFSGITSLFGGGGPKRFDTLGEAVDKKGDLAGFRQAIRELSIAIGQSANSLRTPGGQLFSAQQSKTRALIDSQSARRDILDTLDIKNGKVAIKNIEDFNAAVDEFGNKLQKEADAIVEVANMRIQQIEDETNALIELNNKALGPIRDKIAQITSLRASVTETFNAAIASVRGGLESPQQNVDRLRANLAGASTPEARTTAANALAGALQQQFQNLQGLASSGAITGEELALQQASILSELEKTRSQTVSDFDRIIEQSKAEEAALVAANEQLSADMKIKIDELKAEAIRQVDKLQEILEELRRGNLSSILSGRQFAHGSEYVGSTGMAMVHRGERITSPENRTQNQGGGIVININGVSGNRQEIVRAIQDALKSNFGNLRGQVQTGGR